MNDKKIIVITGVTSFLGRNIARKFISDGYIVYGIVRPKSQNLDNVENIKGLNLIQLDFDKYKMSDIESLSLNIKNDYDITFFHFGWGATLERDNFKKQILNIDYSMKILAFAYALKAKKFIFAGSQAEYSDSPYGMAKREFGVEANLYLKNKKLDFIHLRIFSMYGKEDRETSLLKTLVSLTKNGKDVELSSCNYPWNFLHIDDFCNIMKMFVENSIATGDYDIASDDTRLLKDLVIEARNSINGKNRLYFGARPDSKEHFAIPDIRKLKNVIGDYQFIKFSEGIKTI